MKAFKLDIYRDNELVYSNVYNNNIVSICDHIVSFPKYLQSKLFVSVRQMYFNNLGELKPKMYKGKFNYSLSCAIDNNTSYKELISFLERHEPNLIENKDFTNE
jgi:hypothetical protein